MSAQLRDGLAFGLQASVVINLYCPTGKSESFTTKKSSWQDAWAPKYLTYLFSATRRYCLATGCTWMQRRTVVLSEWRDWWEFLCSQRFSPWSSKRVVLRYSNGSIKVQKELKLKCSLSPWGSPVNNGNAAIEISNNKSRAVMRHEVKSF